MLNLKGSDFIEFVKEKDIDLYEKTKIVSILYKCKKPIYKIINKKGELLLKGIGTLKRDLYKEEQDYIDKQQHE